MNYLFRISGRVQGVGYRIWAAKRMQSMTVRGWVRNITDGRVELYAETDRPDAIEKVLYKGPVFASVKQVEVLPTQKNYVGDEHGVRRVSAQKENDADDHHGRGEFSHHRENDADRLTQPQEFAILDTASDVCQP